MKGVLLEGIGSAKSHQGGMTEIAIETEIGDETRMLVFYLLHVALEVHHSPERTALSRSCVQGQ
jgi:hypothetical protein